MFVLDWPLLELFVAPPVKALINIADIEWIDALEERRLLPLLLPQVEPPATLPPVGLLLRGSESIELECDCDTPALSLSGLSSSAGWTFRLELELAASDRRLSPPPPKILLNKLVIACWTILIVYSIRRRPKTSANSWPPVDQRLASCSRRQSAGPMQSSRLPDV